MQRSVVPVLAESEFGVPAGSFTALESGFWFTAAAMAISGLWVALAMEETLACLNPHKLQ